MKPRHWVTLGIRLLGLGFIIWGVAKLLMHVEIASSPALKMMRGMSGEQDMADLLAPPYLPILLWVLLGVALITTSAWIAKLLFLGLSPTNEALAEPPNPPLQRP